MATHEKLPWLLLPCVMLTLGSVTLLVPRHPAQAAPPAASTATHHTADAYDDGDGDELLEHWGDPKYAREERIQMAGVAGGFLLLVGVAWRKRTVKNAGSQVESENEQEEQIELRKAA